MTLYPNPDPRWPSLHGHMDHHPISVIVKHGEIISAYLYERNGDYGVSGEVGLQYHTGLNWSTEHDTFPRDPEQTEYEVSIRPTEGNQS